MIVALTEQLIEWNEKMSSLLEQDKSQFDFKRDIQPFIEEIDTVIAKWEVVASEWIKQTKPRHIHQLQIEQVCENIRANALECFGTAKPRRFRERQKAIDYVLQHILTHERI